MNTGYKYIGLLILLAGVIGSTEPLWARATSGESDGSGSKSTPLAPRIRQIEELETKAFDGNEWMVLVPNNGEWARYVETLNISGGIWPRGSSNNTIFSSGLWIGAMVNEEVRVSAVYYGSSFAAGPIHAGGMPADPSNPAYRVYKVNRWDSVGVADWNEWPDSLGAPVDTAGEPYVAIDQTLFAVYNDLGGSSVFGSTPLGAEVRQTIYGGITAEASGLNRSFYIKYQIINRSDATWEAPRFSIWGDPDVGDYSDDLVAFDRETNLAICYNDSIDDMYGVPPAIGYQLLEGPAGDSLTAFCFSTGGGGDIYGDPDHVFAAYNRQLGLTLEGLPITNPVTSEETTFMATGDPVAGTGWLDDVGPADKRIVATTAADSVAPGDTVNLLFCVTIALGVDNLNSITALRAAAAEARAHWESDFAGVTLVDRPILDGRAFIPDVIFDPVDPGPPYNMIDLVLMNSGNQHLTGFADFPAESPFTVEIGSFGIAPGGSQTLTIIFYAPTVTSTTLSVPTQYATIQEAIDAAQLHIFFDSLHISTNDPYAAQSHNASVSGSVHFDGDLIAVDPGTYTENLVIQDRIVHLLCQGEPGSAIIDGSQAGSCVVFRNTTGTSIMGFTIENGSAYRGGGINAENSHVDIQDNIIRNNHATYGGGLSTFATSGSIVRNLIINNDADNLGGGMRLFGSTLVFANNTVWGNTAPNGTAGAVVNYSPYPLINCIIWGNGEDTLQVSEGAEIVYSTLSCSWPGEGNIIGDPLFVDPDNGDFQLQAGSPSIDGGTARFVWGEDELINLPPEEYAGWAPDMGAIESPYTGDICGLAGLWVGYVNSWMEDTVMVFEWPGVFDGQTVEYQWRDCWYFTDSNLVAFGYFLPDAGETEPAEWFWGTYAISGESIVLSGFAGEYDFWNGTMGFTFELVSDFPDFAEYRYTGCSIGLSGSVNSASFTWYLLPMDTEGLKADVMALEPPTPLPVSVEGGYLALPLNYALHQNYPNPFNPVSTIRYDLPQADEVSLIVHDILGREVVRLVEEYLEPGYYQIQWDGRDRRGRGVPSGVYFARIVTSRFTKSIKMVLLK